MAPKSKKYKEERLAKQRLCQRRRYAEIKNDPELLALQKEKRRQRYLKNKEKISNKSLRAQREQQKRWRENSKRYRLKKKVQKQPTFEPVEIEAVASTSADVDERNIDSTINFLEDPLIKHDSGCKEEIQKVKYQEIKKRKRLLHIIASYKNKNKTQARQILRLKKKVKELKEKTKVEITPTTLDILNNDCIETKSQPVASSDTSAQNTIKKCIQDFYLEDANSVLSAGKKEYITKSKVQMQKRYLCLPLKDLYKKFLSETKMRVCYSVFCRHRPFWVVFPDKSNRETCQCAIHANMILLIECLNRASVISEKTYEQVLSKMCCDSKNIQCLQRNCDICKTSCLEYNLTTPNRDLTFYEWKKITKEVTLANGNKKKQVLTEKVKVTAKTEEAITKLEKDLITFLNHTYKIVNQYNTFKILKENLTFQEACVHVDFSENYSLKYGAEVQSFHFGGSRQQVTLHTAVIYTHNYSAGKVIPQSMCTISDCLRHDAAAVWAHLVPLIEEVIKINPFIDTIHFLSDSPTSQYRNKHIFYIISQIWKDFPQILRITWNYSEAGHGKGAPDGVGATLKRTADRMVTFGKDVGTYNQFCDLISKCIQDGNLNVVLRKVEGKDVALKESLLPKNLKPFRGTFSVYQILWNKSVAKMTLRSMSCFDCDDQAICIHGKHLGYVEDEKENEPNRPEILPSNKTKTSRVVVLSDITINKANVNVIFPKPSTSKDAFY